MTYELNRLKITNPSLEHEQVTVILKDVVTVNLATQFSKLNFDGVLFSELDDLIVEL